MLIFTFCSTSLLNLLVEAAAAAIARVVFGLAVPDALPELASVLVALFLFRG